MDDWTRKYHDGLGLYMKINGVWVCVNPWFGIYAAFMRWVEERWRERWDAGRFDPLAFKQELNQLLPTPEAWEQAKIEMERYPLFLRNLRNMSSEELAHYLKTLRDIDLGLVNAGVLFRIVAKGGNPVGLPNALKEVLTPEIQGLAMGWITSKYVYEHGSQNKLTWWGGRGIGDALKHLDELEDLDIVSFLEKYIDTWTGKGFWSIRAPGHKKGKRDLLDHPRELIRIDKGLRADHSLHVEREDEDRKDSYELTLGDAIGTTGLDDEQRALGKLEEAVQTLTNEQRYLFSQVYIGGVSLKKLSRGDQQEYARLRKRASRAGRSIAEILQTGVIAPKRRRGRPKKRP